MQANKKLKTGRLKRQNKPCLPVKITGYSKLIPVKLKHNNKVTHVKLDSRSKSHKISLVGTMGSPYVCMHINKTPIKGMIDTGASHSCITSAAVKKYLGKQVLKKLTAIDLTLAAANGSYLKILGQLEVDLKIGNTVINHPLIVFENTKCEFLIGNDVLLDKFNVVKSRYVSPAQNTNEKIPIQYVNKGFTAHTIKQEKFPPLTVMEINLIAPVQEKESTIGCDVELYGIPNDQNLVIEPVIATPDSRGYIRCLIANPTGEYVTLNESTEIAHAQFLHDEHHQIGCINSINEVAACTAELSHDAEAEQELLKGNEQGTLPEPPGYDGTSFDKYNPEEVAKLDHLTSDQKEKVLKLIRKYPTAFAKSDADIGTTDLMTHKIDVTGVTPIADPYRPVPVKFEEEVSSKINELLQLGVITEAKQSPWASNLVIVRKKDSGKIRICCDLRGPNSVSKHKNKWPIRSIESSFAKLANAKYVTSLDLLSAYWTIKMDEESSKVTAFYGPNAKHYQWERMPFGLAAAPHTYCQLMSKVLQGLDAYCFFYFDDIIIFSSTFDDHIEHLDSVIKRFNDAGFKINAKKCNFLCTEEMPIEWLGSVIKHGKVFTDQKKVEAIQNITPPKSVKELQAFIGAVGFHRRHISHLADLINPLVELTKAKKKDEFIWTNEHQHSFEQTKKALCAAEGLKLPDVNKPFILTSDSSNIAIGVCLSQVDDKGVERICAYGSRKFREIEQRNMSIPEKELAGILYGVKLFAYYLYNNKFTIKTDARSLVFLKRFKTCNSKIARAALWLQEFDFDIIHESRKNGNTMAIADCLSRAHESQFKLEGYKALKNPQLNEWPDIKLPQYCEMDEFDEIADKFLQDNPIEGKIEWISEEPDIPISLSINHITTPTTLDALASYEHRILHVSLVDACMTPADFAHLQQEDEEIQKLRSKADIDADPEYTIVKGVLMKKVVDGLRVVVPMSFRNELIKWHHGSFWAHHVGSKKLHASLARYYYWPNMFKTIKEIVQSCKICQYIKPDTTGGTGIGRTKTPTRPNQLVAFDVVTGLPRTTAGHNCILVIVDDFTKFCTAVEMKDKTAESVASAFINYWVRFFGPPKQLHSDEGTEVDSSLMQNICTLLEIRKSHTPIYNPKSDGTVERLNQSIGNMIQAYVTEYNKTKWNLLLPFMVSGYNNLVHTATGYSPSDLLFGYNTAHNMVPLVNIENELLSKSEYLQILRTGQEIKWRIVNRRLETLKDIRVNNSKQKPHSYQIGDFVLIKDLTPKVAKTAADKGTKHHRRWKGPYRILHQYPQSLIIVHWEKDLPPSENIFSHQGELTKRNVILVHPNQCKPFIGNVEREPLINEEIIDNFLTDLGMKVASKDTLQTRSEKTKYNLRNNDVPKVAHVKNFRSKERRRKRNLSYFYANELDSSSDDDDDYINNRHITFRPRIRRDRVSSWSGHTPTSQQKFLHSTPFIRNPIITQDGEKTPLRRMPSYDDSDTFFTPQKQSKSMFKNPVVSSEEDEIEIDTDIDDDVFEDAPSVSERQSDFQSLNENVENPKNSCTATQSGGKEEFSPDDTIIGVDLTTDDTLDISNPRHYEASASTNIDSRELQVTFNTSKTKNAPIKVTPVPVPSVSTPLEGKTTGKKVTKVITPSSIKTRLQSTTIAKNPQDDLAKVADSQARLLRESTRRKAEAQQTKQKSSVRGNKNVKKDP